MNGLGARTSRTDALGNVTNYTLDNWLRVTTVDYPTGTDPTFSYDVNGNLTGWTDGQGTWSRTYDACNRLTNESLNSNTRFSYAYDGTGKKGRLASITDASSRTVTYAYTDRGQLYTVADSAGTTTYSYDSSGNETGTTLPNTATVTKAYDSANRLTSVTNRNSAGTTLSCFSYGYQNDNLRSSCTESNGDVVSYGYDAAHRLTSESRTGLNAYSYSYTVDGVGNRTSQTKGGVTTSFTLNSDDELTATSGGFTNSYSYNAAGDQTNRTLSGTSNTLAYDYEGQLTSITVGGATTSFAYDALGRRITRTAGGTTKQFLSSGSQVWLESVGGSVTATYTHGNGLIRKDGEYFQVDGLGSARTITNGSQTVTGTATYEGFGATIATTGSSASPYLFAATSGYRTDGDAGLMHVGARYYDPQVGRFITRDTYLDQHPYLYCDHDPVNAVDPTGNFKFSIGVSINVIAVVVSGWADGSVVVDVNGWNPAKWKIGVVGHVGAGLGSGAFIGGGVQAGGGPGHIKTGRDDGNIGGFGAGWGPSIGGSSGMTDDWRHYTDGSGSIPIKFMPGIGYGVGAYAGRQIGYIRAFN